jgi:hypothetical protein
MQAAAVTRASAKRAGWPGPAAQQVGQERSDHRRGVLVGVGGTPRAVAYRV